MPRVASLEQWASGGSPRREEPYPQQSRSVDPLPALYVSNYGLITAVQHQSAESVAQSSSTHAELQTESTVTCCSFQLGMTDFTFGQQLVCSACTLMPEQCSCRLCSVRMQQIHHSTHCRLRSICKFSYPRTLIWAWLSQAATLSCSCSSLSTVPADRISICPRSPAQPAQPSTSWGILRGKPSCSQGTGPLGLFQPERKLEVGAAVISQCALNVHVS